MFFLTPGLMAIHVLRIISLYVFNYIFIVGVLLFGAQQLQSELETCLSSVRIVHTHTNTGPYNEEPSESENDRLGHARQAGPTSLVKQAPPN